MIPNGNPVEALPELLRSLCWFGRNLFCDRVDGPYLCLAKQQYPAHIPASHRDHIFLSKNHLVATQKTI